MKCEVINTKDKVFIIYRNNHNMTIKMYENGNKEAKVYQNYSDMLEKDYNELIYYKNLKLKNRQH